MCNSAFLNIFSSKYLIEECCPNLSLKFANLSYFEVPSLSLKHSSYLKKVPLVFTDKALKILAEMVTWFLTESFFRSKTVWQQFLKQSASWDHIGLGAATCNRSVVGVAMCTFDEKCIYIDFRKGIIVLLLFWFPDVLGLLTVMSIGVISKAWTN